MQPLAINRRWNRLATTSRARGFSLVELTIAISIMVILLAVIGPVFVKSSLKARQAAREVVQGNLTRARAHAIATGVPTAVLFFQYQSGQEGGKTIGIAEVTWQEAVDASAVGGYEATSLLQRRDILPGNMMFLTSGAVNYPQLSIMDETTTVTPSVGGKFANATYIVFGSNGQIVFPADKPIEILLGPARLANGNVELLERNNGMPSFDRLQVNRLTGKARQRSALLQ